MNSIDTKQILLLLAISSIPAYASENNLEQNINISGLISNHSCTVNLSADTIQFPNTYSDELPNVESRNTAILANVDPILSLSNCEANQQYTITVEGAEDSGMSGAFINDSGAAYAKGVDMFSFINIDGQWRQLEANRASPAMAVSQHGDNGSGVELSFGIGHGSGAPVSGDIHIVTQVQVDYL